MDESAWAFGPGNFNDPGVNYDWESGAGSSFSFGSAVNGATSLLGNLANVWGAVEVQKIKASTPTYFRGMDGRLYREGQPGAVYGGQGGGLSPLTLILLAGLAFLVMKD